MRIGLLGFTFHNANKGCEALTYSFINIINNILPDNIEYRYYSYSDDYGLVRNHFPDTVFTNYSLTRKKILTGLLSDFKSCDIIFDISYGDGFSDIYNPKGVFWNTLVKSIAIKSKRPLVLLPQTYGPFERKFLEKQAAKAIKKSALVYSRDNMSTEYIKHITGLSAITVTDLAFTLPYEKASVAKSNKTKIGINVSGLLWKGGFYNSNQFGLSVDYKTYIETIIESLSANSQNELYLIPHVIENIQGSNDGDLYINDILSKKYSSLIGAPAFKDPVETKNYIACMDVVIAARMHATVDAFSSGVPVIPFAYSRKFEGLYGSLGYNYIIDGKTLSTEEAIRQTLSWIENKDTIKKDLTTCSKLVDEKTDMFINSLKSFLIST